MSSAHQDTIPTSRNGIDHTASAAPLTIPASYVGEFVIPGTGRRVWWTGRVAIGLRYQPERCREPMSQSSLWVQKLMLYKPRWFGSAAHI